MTLQEALKYNGKALGEIKCTYAALYNPSDTGYYPIYAIRAEWVQQNSSSGNIFYTSDELARIAEMYPSDVSMNTVARYEDGGLIGVTTAAIVRTTSDMQSDGKFRAVHLLSDGMIAVDRGIERTIQKWQERIREYDRTHSGIEYHLTVEYLKEKLFGKPSWYAEYAVEASHYMQILAAIQAQADSAQPMYVLESAIRWYPDMSDDFGRDPYTDAYEAAEKELERMKYILIAAGAASLI